MSRWRILFAVVLLAAAMASGAVAQHSKAQPGTPAATVNSVRVVHERGIPAIEVVSTSPLVPAVQSLDSPPRLVIDLPNARTSLLRKKIPVLQENILTLRTEQYQNDPPVVRIVLDLLIPYGYTWDAAGNRLMVRLKPPEDPNAQKKTPSQSPQVLSAETAEAPALVPVTSGVGDVVLAGSRFAAGSSLTAGSEITVLRLARGGEVRLCPGTTLSLTPSKTTKDLMLGMGTGAVELHYSLGASADTVLTPDFRILFAGPGEFHYAVSSDPHGNTCVRGLRGNSSTAVVSELIGDRIYQVQPNEQAVFHGGRIDKVDSQVPLECGCPPPVPVMRAEAAPAKVIPNSEAAANLTLAEKPPAATSAKGSEGDSKSNSAPETLSSGPETQPLPPSQPGDVHVTVDAPFVFHGKDQAATPGAPLEQAATLPVMKSSVSPAPIEAQVQAPPPQSPEAKPERRRFMKRIKGFFSAIFGG